MGRKPYGTPAQQQFLYGRLPTFERIHASRSYDANRAFHNETRLEWVRRFIDPNGNVKDDLPPDVRRSIYFWFTNHNRANTNKTGSKRSWWDVFSHSTRKKKVDRPAWEALYLSRIDDGIEATIDAAFKAHYPNFHPDDDPLLRKIAYRQAYCTDLYHKLTAEEQAKIEELRSSKTLPSLEKALGDNGLYLENRRKQESIDLLPKAMEAALIKISEATGWSATIVLGGPMPKLDGRRETYSFNIGETAEELAFENWHEDFEVATREPFREFINDVYNDEFCASVGTYYSEAEVLEEVLYISEELDLVIEKPTTDDDEVVEVKKGSHKKGSHKKGAGVQTSVKSKKSRVTSTIKTSDESEDDDSASGDSANEGDREVVIANRTHSGGNAEKDLQPLATGSILNPIALTSSPSRTRATSSDNTQVDDPPCMLTVESAPLSNLDTVSPTVNQPHAEDSASSMSMMSLSIAVPPEAPQWIAGTLTFLSGFAIGKLWPGILKKWLILETYHQYPESKMVSERLPSKERPIHVTKWLSAGKKLAVPTNLFDPIDASGARRSSKNFESTFVKWYISLLPIFRFGDDGGSDIERPSNLPLPQPTLSSNHIWKSIDRAGPNGFAVLLIGLAWWASLDTKGVSLQTLKLLVEDIDYTLDGILLTYADAKDDGAEEDPNNASLIPDPVAADSLTNVANNSETSNVNVAATDKSKQKRKRLIEDNNHTDEAIEPTLPRKRIRVTTERRKIHDATALPKPRSVAKPKSVSSAKPTRGKRTGKK